MPGDRWLCAFCDASGDPGRLPEGWAVDLDFRAACGPCRGAGRGRFPQPEPPEPEPQGAAPEAPEPG
jgi:hypothetical protein